MGEENNNSSSPVVSRSSIEELEHKLMRKRELIEQYNQKHAANAITLEHCNTCANKNRSRVE